MAKSKARVRDHVSQCSEAITDSKKLVYEKQKYQKACF